MSLLSNGKLELNTGAHIACGEACGDPRGGYISFMKHPEVQSGIDDVIGVQSDG